MNESSADRRWADQKVADLLVRAFMSIAKQMQALALEVRRGP